VQFDAVGRQLQHLQRLFIDRVQVAAQQFVHDFQNAHSPEVAFKQNAFLVPVVFDLHEFFVAVLQQFLHVVYAALLFFSAMFNLQISFF